MADGSQSGKSSIELLRVRDEEVGSSSETSSETAKPESFQIPLVLTLAAANFLNVCLLSPHGFTVLIPRT